MSTTCLDYSLKAMVAMALNGSHIIETNVVEDASPLQHDDAALYQEGTECISHGAIWERTSFNAGQPTSAPGIVIGKWLYVESIRYSTASEDYGVGHLPYKNNYFRRVLTEAEKGGDSFLLYAMWQSLDNQSSWNAFPAINTSDANWTWVGKTSSVFYQLDLWTPQNYNAGDIVWQPYGNGYANSYGSGFIALENIIHDNNHPYINQPLKIEPDANINGKEWTFKREANQYRLLNSAPTSVTTAPDEIYYKFLIKEPFKDMAFRNVDTLEIEVLLTDISETVELYHEIHSMTKPVLNAYQYFFENDVSINDLLVEDMEMINQSILTIRIKNPTKISQLGGFYLGILKQLGHLTSVGAGGSGYTEYDGRRIDKANSLNKFSHNISVDISKFDQTREYLREIGRAGAEGRPTFYKATGFLKEAWGVAFPQDHIVITENDGNDQAHVRIEVKELH